MDTKELRKLNKKDLEKRLIKKREELGDTRFDILTGKEKNTAGQRYIRKEIARIITILKEETHSKTETEKKVKSKGVVKKGKR